MKSDVQSSSREFWLFVTITFTWSWLFWLPAVLSTSGWIELPGIVSSVLVVVAVFGPSVAAFSLLYRYEGRAGVVRLWKRGWRWGVGKRWLAPVLLILPGVAVLTVLLMTLLGEPLQMEHAVPVVMIVPVFILIYLLNALPEEYGWRGYALDRLQFRWNALAASIILGAIWGLWHVPLHFIEGTLQEIMPVWHTLAVTLVMAVIYTWVYNNTGGSVLAVTLLHAFGNTSSAALPWYVSDTGRLLAFGLLSVVAVVIIITWSPKALAGKRVQATRPEPGMEAPA